MLDINQRVRIFCVGTAKSGTHSIHSIFENNSKAMHEPENKLLLDYILGYYQNDTSKDSILRYIKDKDRRLVLDVDSSQLNYFILDFLLEEFNDSKFILTIRDCYSWLDSFINHSLAYPSINEKWHRFRELRFGKITTYPKEEKILMEHELFTLDSYFNYWAIHNQTVISKIPSDKLLIVKTSEISNSIKLLESFSGIKLTNVPKDRTHIFKNPQKFNILKNIDQSYIEKKSGKYCHSLMCQYFPEIKSIKDSV